MYTLKAQCGVAGRYKLRKGRYDSNGNEVTTQETGWFDNLITDAGLNLLGTGSYLNACQVGAGTAAPSVGDTSLGSFVAGTTTINSNVAAAQSTAPYYGSRTITYRFAEGDAAGNLSEVGIGTEATGGTLFSRSRITDGAGDPTTITVLADEFLDVVYELQLVPPTADVVTQLTDTGPAGTLHDLTLRASNVNSVDVDSSPGWSPPNGGPVVLDNSTAAQRVYEGTIGAITESPSGLSDSIFGGVITADAYSNLSLQSTGTLEFGLNQGNLAGGVSALRFVFTGMGMWQVGFSPDIVKDDTKVLTFSVSVSWTRTTAL